MRKLVRLNKDIFITYNNEIKEFLSPDFIYVPLRKGYTPLVKNNDKVKKGSIILENNLNKVLCGISGIIEDTTEKKVNGQKVSTIKIKNDFEEKEITSANVKKLTTDPEDIVSKLYTFGFKYIASILESKKINNLVISAIEDEPYILNDVFIINKYYKEILDMTDVLSKAFNINNTLITMKNNDVKNIEKYLSNIGSYPNITLNLVPDKYLLGTEYFLLEYLNLRSNETLVIDVKLLLEIYNALKYGKHTYTTFITVAGPCLFRSMVLQVKEGTLLKEVIENNIKINDSNVLYIVNGLMKGNTCNVDKEIITKNTKGIIIIPNKQVAEEKCSKCGLCYNICPVKVNPKKVMDTGKRSVNCIDCGLCSYICPSHINLRKYLRGKDE